MIDTGILFRDPTRLKVVGVVVERNQSTEKEIPNETIPVRDATTKKDGLKRSGCCGRVASSPCMTMTKKMRGSERRLL